MTLTATVSDANANLIETYFRLGRATPGSTVWVRGHLQGCSGEFNHPICNFVVGSNLDENDIRILLEVSTSQDPLHVYLPPSPAFDHDERQLVGAGFGRIYSLKQMVAEPLHEVPNLSPVEASSYLSRLALARFMVGQFFSLQPKTFREGIARSTARAGGLELYAVGFKNEIVGGVMLCREGSMLGVYNLCVKSEFQCQGWGRSIIHWARAIAGIEGRILTLQCDERLSAWYSRCGFSQIGEIVAFSKSKGGLFDTM